MPSLPPFFNKDDNIQQKVQVTLVRYDGNEDEERMLLQHISDNITTLKQLSDKHYTKTETFMTQILDQLAKMTDHLENVLDRVLGQQQ